MRLQSIVPGEQREPMRSDGSKMVRCQASPAAADTTLEFGRFRILLRRRQLLADGVPVELGTRAFDLLMVLIDADGALVTSDELLALVWPGIFVDASNLKVQVCALRKAFGEDRDFLRTEIGRGYRFTAVIHTYENPSPTRRRQKSHRNPRLDRSPRRVHRRHKWRAGVGAGNSRAL
jgi:DNA-binding winged helix-turn-helix (wHTH) protein